MRRKLIRLHDEALRLLTIYEDCDDEFRRRKVHLDLDRFLMQHREVATRVRGLEIKQLRDTVPPSGTYL